MDIKKAIIAKMKKEPYTTNRELYEYLRMNKFNCSFTSVAKQAQVLRSEGKIPPIKRKPMSVEDVVIENRAHRKERNEKSALKMAADRIEELEKQGEALFAIKKTPQHFSYIPTNDKDSEAVAFLVASDWHVEEPVDPSTVNDMNEYNTEIAKQRAEKFFTNGVKLVKIFQKDTKIKKIVLALLGDFFSNTIHEELAESNEMMPGDAAWYAQSLLLSGIQYILKNTDCDLVVVCHSGNHGRMTKKVHISTEAGNSLERFMYRNMAEILQDKRLTWIIPTGMMSYHQVFGLTVRCLHGHSVKFGGGVGGITIPVRKAISQWDRVKRADVTIMGHFHQCVDGGNFIVNGSLIGYNAFAQFIKADYEAPRQQFFLVTNHGGGEKSVVAPIRLS